MKKTMTDQELIEMAYKAMDAVNDHSSCGGLYRGFFDGELHHLKKRLSQGNFVIPIQREWQGLTDEERQECLYSDPIFGMAASTFARAIEAKLKEKNS